MNNNYEPLSPENQALINHLIENYATKKIENNNAKTAYIRENRMLKVELQKAKKNDMKQSIDFLTEEIDSNNFKIKNINLVLDTSRPVTPKGQSLCTMCDVIGMAPYKVDAKRDMDTYKCQSCGYEQVVSTSLMDYDM